MAEQAETRNIILSGGIKDGTTMTVPKFFPINYAKDEEGTILYVNSGNIDEHGREIWVPLNSEDDPLKEEDSA